MSHGKQRKEKDCLNCGTYIKGKFCQNCGQENIQPGETLWQMIRHFFEDITHFDGKFFGSIRKLVTRPGLLSKSYTEGQRQRYLHPVRMYVFTSALFFLVFFSLSNKELVKIKSMENSQANAKDSIIHSLSQAYLKGDTQKDYVSAIAKLTQKDKVVSKADIDYLVANGITPKHIDSLEHKRKQRIEANKIEGDDYVSRSVSKKLVNVFESESPAAFFKEFIEGFVHKFPYIFFVSLPFFAWIMQLLFIRRKEFTFFHHAIFTIHLYIFTFIAGLLVILFSYLETKLPGAWLFKLLTTGIILYAVAYPMLAVKHFYHTSWLKAFLKTSLMFFLGTFMWVLIAFVFAAIQLLLL